MAKFTISSESLNSSSRASQKAIADFLERDMERMKQNAIKHTMDEMSSLPMDIPIPPQTVRNSVLSNMRKQMEDTLTALAVKCVEHHSLGTIEIVIEIPDPQ